MALNLENLTNENLQAIGNKSEFETLIHSGLIQSIKPISNKLFVNIKLEKNLFLKEIKMRDAVRFQLCNVLFGVSMNWTRREIHKQVLSSSLYLSISKSDIIITMYHTTTTPHHHKLFEFLRVDLYSRLIHHWNGQLKPYSFPLTKNRIN